MNEPTSVNILLIPPNTYNDTSGLSARLWKLWGEICEADETNTLPIPRGWIMVSGPTDTVSNQFSVQFNVPAFPSQGWEDGLLQHLKDVGFVVTPNLSN